MMNRKKLMRFAAWGILAVLVAWGGSVMAVYWVSAGQRESLSEGSETLEFGTSVIAAKAAIGRWWSEVGRFSRRGVFRQDLQDLQD